MVASETVRANISSKVSKLETKPLAQLSTEERELYILAAEGEMLRRCRVRMDAALRDVAELAHISHTALGEIEAGTLGNKIHRQNVRKALLRIIAARQQVMADCLQELLG